MTKNKLCLAYLYHFLATWAYIYPLLFLGINLDRLGRIPKSDIIAFIIYETILIIAVIIAYVLCERKEKKKNGKVLGNVIPDTAKARFTKAV